MYEFLNDRLKSRTLSCYHICALSNLDFYEAVRYRIGHMPTLKKIIVGALILSFFLPVIVDARRSSGGSVRVRGYTRRDGTYVQPHYRSAPDGNPYNNWSFPGNTNPYTGETATGDPDTYLRNYYDRSGGSSYSLPSYSTPSLTPSYTAPSYSSPSYSSPSYTAPSYSSFSTKPKQIIYRRAKEVGDSGTGCYSSGLNSAEISDCFTYALNKDSFDWEIKEYQASQPATVSVSTPAPTQVLLPVPQTASVARSPYTMTIGEQGFLIQQLELQIAALQRQLNALTQSR